MILFAILVIAAVAGCNGAHDFKWAMRLQEMRDAIFSFIREEDWNTQNQIRQVSREMVEMFARETGIAEDRWQELGALHDHFGKLSGWGHRDWFKTSDPCEWENVWCHEAGKMTFLLTIGPNELQADKPVTHALKNVNELRLSFNKDCPEVDLAYIARLFPNVEKLGIWSYFRVEYWANLAALETIPLKNVEIREIHKPLPVEAWLAHTPQLNAFYLFDLGFDSESDQTELDLRGVIPPTLENLVIDLQHDHPGVKRVLFSDDMITAREQPDGSVIHPLRLNLYASSPYYEMECRTLDPDARPIEAERERPNGIHPLTIVYDYQMFFGPDLSHGSMSKFAVLA